MKIPHFIRDDNSCFEIAELLHTSWLTVWRPRHRFIEGNLDIALNELPWAGRLLKIDDRIETILTTLAQSQPPDGRVRWTLQFSADRLVALTRPDSLSHEAVRLVLKNNLKPWQRQKWCIPTIIGAKFVWRMEDVMDLYAEPYQPAFPVICFDEVPYQMVSETWLPLPMRNGIPGRYDFEYRREDTCNLLMLLQPLAGWRHVKVTDQRSKQEFAWCMQDLVEIHFPEAEKIRSQEGSQVFGANESGAWECERNAHRATNDWRFTIPNARDKVKKLYPVSEE